MENEKKEYQEKKRTLFFGLPWTFTWYVVGEEFLTVKKGPISKDFPDGITSRKYVS